MVKTAIFTIGCALLFGGCAAKLTEPEMDFKPPRYVEEMPSKVDERDFTSTGSIFGQGDNPLFSDHKAMHVNDIVTVVISEAARSSNSVDKSLSESVITSYSIHYTKLYDITIMPPVPSALLME